MYERYLKIFNNYVSNYNEQDKNIDYKIEHSYRVANLCVEIAKALELSIRDIEICYVCGLFHDIGRFEQLTKTKSFADSKDIDHGDIGAEVLKKNLIEYTTNDKEIQRILIDSTRYHNKLQIGEVEENELIFCKIVRDADKIDTLSHWLVDIEGVYELNEKILKSLYNKETSSEKVNNDMDMILRMICFIFDINFEYSYRYLKDHGIIKNKLELLKIHCNDDTDKLINFIDDFLESKI